MTALPEDSRSIVADGIQVYCAHDAVLPIEKCVPNPRNPNRHPDRQVDLLAKIIRAQGWRAPITISTRSGFIVRGHGRLLAAQKLGVSEVPVDYQGYASEAEEWADLVADNRIAELAEIDTAALSDLLQELNINGFDLELTGHTVDDLEKLLTQCHVDLDEIEEDEVPDPPEASVTNPGDLWLLGRHRLLCGDCRQADQVDRLLGDSKIDSLVTDPPYGVDYGAKTEFLNRFDSGNRIRRPIVNDALTEYRQFFADFLALIPFADYNTVYIFMSGQELHSLRLAAEDCGITWGDYLVWVKNTHVLGRKDYNARHEFVFYGWKGKHRFFGGFSTSILEFDKPARNELHSTQKPVRLMAKLISDGSPRGGLVYDPFAGSGTTLIAAECQGRNCYAMEIDPVYCDVIVERWQNLTGQNARRS